MDAEDKVNFLETMGEVKHNAILDSQALERIMVRTVRDIEALEGLIAPLEFRIDTTVEEDDDALEVVSKTAVCVSRVRCNLLMLRQKLSLLELCSIETKTASSESTSVSDAVRDIPDKDL